MDHADRPPSLSELFWLVLNARPDAEYGVLIKAQFRRPLAVSDLERFAADARGYTQQEEAQAIGPIIAFLEQRGIAYDPKPQQRMVAATLSGITILALANEPCISYILSDQ